MSIKAHRYLQVVRKISFCFTLGLPRPKLMTRVKNVKKDFTRDKKSCALLFSKQWHKNYKDRAINN